MKDFISFLDVPIQTDLNTLKADVAFLGVPYAIPYEIGQIRSASAPNYIREKSFRVGRARQDSLNLDRKATPCDLSKIHMVDCGDIQADPMDSRQYVIKTEETVRRIIERGTIPIIFGGDDAVPIPVVKAFRNHGPITVIQIDEHLDWADERGGVDEGFSSPMRRVSEMNWVNQTVQAGLHAYTPAAQYKDATNAGNILITEREFHEQGVESILKLIPDGGDFFITVDFDGLDSAVFPAVSNPEPGGLNYHETIDFLCGIAGKGRIVGMSFVEMVPDHDLNGLSGYTIGRIITNILHSMVESGQFA